MAERHPSAAEQTLYRHVFGTSLPVASRIYISDSLGLHNRPWTSPRYFRRPTSWTINIGPVGYIDCTSTKLGIWGSRIDATFIHELVHVWQGSLHFLFDQYLLEGAVLQARAELSSYDPYIYTAGGAWSEFNIEQKAQLVEDWYTSGMSSTDPRYTYITGNIRCCVD